VTSDEMIDFVEREEAQLWPERDRRSGSVRLWVVQVGKRSFVQVSRATLRAAIEDAAALLAEIRRDKSGRQ
jgi:hypothetical protein